MVAVEVALPVAAAAAGQAVLHSVLAAGGLMVIGIYLYCFAL